MAGTDCCLTELAGAGRLDANGMDATDHAQAKVAHGAFARLF
jgi:hypothetical protein